MNFSSNNDITWLCSISVFPVYFLCKIKIIFFLILLRDIDKKNNTKLKVMYPKIYGRLMKFKFLMACLFQPWSHVFYFPFPFPVEHYRSYSTGVFTKQRMFTLPMQLANALVPCVFISSICKLYVIRVVHFDVYLT